MNTGKRFENWMMTLEEDELEEVWAVIFGKLKEQSLKKFDESVFFGSAPIEHLAKAKTFGSAPPIYKCPICGK